MSLQSSNEGYTFRADAEGLTIEPGPKAITLSRQDLGQLGLQPRDDYRIPIELTTPKEDVTGRILSALGDAISRCRGPGEMWMAQDLQVAVVNEAF